MAEVGFKLTLKAALDIDSPDRYVHGQRVVLPPAPVSLDPMEGLTRMFVMDFNPHPKRLHDPGDAVLEDERSHDWDYLIQASASVVPAGDVYQNDVTTTLPYAFSSRKGQLRYTGLMIDDQRLVGIKVSADAFVFLNPAAYWLRRTLRSLQVLSATLMFSRFNSWASPDFYPVQNWTMYHSMYHSKVGYHLETVSTLEDVAIASVKVGVCRMRRSEGNDVLGVFVLTMLGGECLEARTARAQLTGAVPFLVLRLRFY